MGTQTQQASFHHIIETTQSAPFGDCAVLGLGKSGLVACRFFIEALALGSPLVKSLTVFGGKGGDEVFAASQFIRDAGIEVVFDEYEVKGHYDTCVTSPGIPEISGFFKSGAAASGAMISEPELAWRLSPKRWVGITGTNGKTTTTTLVAHLLASSGIPAQPVGNIGDTCLAGVADRKAGEYLVAELSSFQLRTMPTFSPEVGVLLNITPDHVEWHGTLKAYAAAKSKLFDNLAPDALAIVCDSDPAAHAIGEGLRARGLRVLGVDPARTEPAADMATLSGDMLDVWFAGRGEEPLCTTGELPIKGEHNIANALSAAGAALFAGATAQQVRDGLLSFKAIEHRIEPCGKVDGVEYYNDSKATNTDATCKALTAFGDKPLIVLLGGHDKMTDLADLVASCAARCSAVVCYGASRERFSKAFQGSGVEVILANHMADAVLAAREHAREGYVVALSPACSSFDEFSCYEERGDAFKGLVASWMAEDADGGVKHA